MKDKIIKKIKDGISFKSKIFNFYLYYKKFILRFLKIDGRVVVHSSHEIKVIFHGLYKNLGEYND